MTPTSVTERLDAVRAEIARACARAGRPESEVKLVAVSKRVPDEALVEAFLAGQFAFGENRIQDALGRLDRIPGLIAGAGGDSGLLRWHFIGHIQGNKAGRASGRFHLLHGVDSEKLASRLGAKALEEGRREPILAEVNISGEGAKQGLPLDGAVEALARMAAIPGLALCGLMGMARHLAPEKELRQSFASLRSLRDQASAATGLPLQELSMGMSGDFVAAIAEGATLVRIGTAIFGPRTP